MGVYIGRMSPVVASYITSGSFTFPGSSNVYYLTVPNDTDLQMGTGDFTIEWFAYYNSTLVGFYPRFFSMGASPNASIGMSLENDGVIYFFFNGANSGNGYTVSTPAVSSYLDRWSHYAICRSGSDIKMFLNGAQQGAIITDSSDHNDSSNVLTIGNEDHATGTTLFQTEFGGNITNFHWVKGTALYTGPFTPPIHTITPISNTKLLITAVTASAVDTSGTSKSITNTSVGWSASTPF